MCLSSDLDPGGMLFPRNPLSSSLLLSKGFGGPMMATAVSGSEGSQADSGERLLCYKFGCHLLEKAVNMPASPGFRV